MNQVEPLVRDARMRNVLQYRGMEEEVALLKRYAIHPSGVWARVETGSYCMLL